jgi:DNA-binding NarL/FixJ family response regulator
MAYVPKSGDPLEVVTAVSSAAKGRHYFVGTTAERLAEYHATGSPDDPINKLTSREFEVFKLTAEGINADQIAVQLGLGLRTVANLLAKIRLKLGLTNPIQFARLAIKYKHINPENLLEF